MNESRENTIELEPERYELCEDPRYQFELDRRGFLEVAGRRDPRPSPAGYREAEQQPGGRRGGGGGGQPAPRDIGAWLHIGEDGKVTVYTGKAEVGQNIRTSLTQVVAEELHSRAGVDSPGDGRHAADAVTTWAPSAAGPRRTCRGD